MPHINLGWPASQAPAPSLHPSLAEVYRAKIAALQGELAKSDSGNTAVLEALRDLIDRVELGPKDANGESEIILTGCWRRWCGWAWARWRPSWLIALCS